MHSSNKALYDTLRILIDDAQYYHSETQRLQAEGIDYILALRRQIRELGEDPIMIPNGLVFNEGV